MELITGFLALFIFYFYLSAIVNRQIEIKKAKILLDNKIAELKLHKRDRLTPYINWLNKLKDHLSEAEKEPFL
ncbi:MAG: hypothetical protein HY606_02100 [Planctomycetes bacterium]|nr:hypothetical protein [Planctomycetota bacterium]